MLGFRAAAVSAILAFAAPVLAQDVDPARVEVLVNRLGDGDWEVREAAEKELVAMGPAVRKLLEERRDHADPEVRDRIERILPRLYPEGGAVDKGVQAILRLERTEIAVGENPGATALLRNVGEEPILLVGSLDASDVGWRAPRCGFRLYDGEGRPIEFPAGGRCGNMNALRSEDVVEVAPGDDFDPYHQRNQFFPDYAWESWKAPAPGEYELEWRYDADEPVEGTWQAAPELRERLARVPRARVTSNRVRFVVKEK